MIAWMTFSPMYQATLRANHLSWLVSPFHDNLIIVAGTLTILMVGLLLSRFSERQIRDVHADSSLEFANNSELPT